MNVMIKNNVEVRDAFREEDYSFTVDWLNVRLNCDNLDLLLCKICSLFPEIDISDFPIRESGGVCFYKEAVYLSKLGYSSFVISFNRDKYGNIINTPTSTGGGTYGILVSISGDGCRYINSLHDNAFVDLLKVFAPFNPRCTRIDVACDIFDKENQIVPLIQSFSDCAYDRENPSVDFNCNLNRRPGWVTCNLVYDDNLKDFTRNVTIGGRSSTKGTLQLYNKRVEIESGRLSEVSDAILNAVGNPDYWWRLEYRCKSFAQKVYDTLVQTGNIYQAFLCAVEEMGAFVVPYSHCHSINKAETCAQWLAFLCFLHKLVDGIHLVQFTQPMVNLPYVGSGLSRVKKYHEEQIPCSLSAYFLNVLLSKAEQQSLFNTLCYQIQYNNKMLPYLDELRVKYGPKLEETLDLIFEQASLFEDIA